MEDIPISGHEATERHTRPGKDETVTRKNRSRFTIHSIELPWEAMVSAYIGRSRQVDADRNLSEASQVKLCFGKRPFVDLGFNESEHMTRKGRGQGNHGWDATLKRNNS